MLERIHITGASGAGVTTLGAALARRLGLVQLDSDTFYWLPSEPPFESKRPLEDRIAMLRAAIDETRGRFVLSGSADPWADPFIPLYDLVVYIDTPTAVRVARVRAREIERYGAAVAPGGARHAASEDFVDWVGQYEIGRREGRNRARHEAWLARLPCPLLRLDGTLPTSDLVEIVVDSRPMS